MMTSRSPCQRNLVYSIGVLVVISLLGGALVWIGSRDVLMDIIERRAIAPTSGWLVVLLCNSLGLAVVIGGWELVISQLLTEFLDDRVKQPRLLGSKAMRWADVDRIVVRGPVVDLVSANDKISLSLTTYKNSNCVIEELRRRVPWAR